MIIQPDRMPHLGFVGVVDVLGFGRLLEKSPSGQNSLESYWALMKDLNAAALDNNAKPFRGGRNEFEISQMVWFVFNDMIVFVQPNATQAAAVHFFEFANELLHKALLLKVPLFLRGGISYGEIRHDSNLYLGEPFAEAYGLEESSQFVGIALHASCTRYESLNVLRDRNFIVEYAGATLKDPVPEKYRKLSQASGYCCSFQSGISNCDTQNALRILRTAAETTEMAYRSYYENSIALLRSLSRNTLAPR